MGRASALGFWDAGLICAPQSPMMCLSASVWGSAAVLSGPGPSLHRWAVNHRQRLLELNSSLEFKLHRLHFICLLAGGPEKQLEALSYARHFQPFARLHQRGECPAHGVAVAAAAAAPAAASGSVSGCQSSCPPGFCVVQLSHAGHNTKHPQFKEKVPFSSQLRGQNVLAGGLGQLSGGALEEEG